VRLEWLCVCLLRVSAGACYILGARVALEWVPPPSPPSGPPPPPGLSAEVKMDEIGDSDECTVGKMDERVTWGLDNRNGPQDPRSKW